MADPPVLNLPALNVNAGGTASARCLTEEYEQWMRTQLPCVFEDHLRYKHEQMGQPGRSAPESDPAEGFRFLRATFYLWAVRIRERLPHLVASNVPQVLGIGDAHIENFGTWRDTEGRLVWGANDLDEATLLPYTNDLVRLATSASLANLAIPESDIAAELIAGYRRSLISGPRPFVIAEHGKHLAKILPRDNESDTWWKAKRLEVTDLPQPVHQAVLHACELLTDSFPKVSAGITFRTRRAGLGSLGRPRVVAIGRWRESLAGREAKAVLPSAWDWSSGTASPTGRFRTLLNSTHRATDPYATVVERWCIRRLSPDSEKISIAKIKRADQRRLLRSMGGELANVHLSGTDATVLMEHLPQNPDWLAQAAQVMSHVVRRDHRNYAQPVGGQ